MDFKMLFFVLERLSVVMKKCNFLVEKVEMFAFVQINSVELDFGATCSHAN